MKTKPEATETRSRAEKGSTQKAVIYLTEASEHLARARVTLELLLARGKGKAS